MVQQATPPEHSRSWPLRWARSLHFRLLLVNLVVLLVPVGGLEFARLFERELLRSLENDMRHQAVSVRWFLQGAPSSVMVGPAPSAAPAEAAPLPPPAPVNWQEHAGAQEAILRRIARDTRMRLRVLDTHGSLVLDSHRFGPPEGEEPEAGGLLSELEEAASLASGRYGGPRWAPVEKRTEVLAALRGERASFTRVRASRPSVLLFVAEPLYAGPRIAGVVYVTRSTQPVLAEMYRIRNGLWKLLSVALVGTITITVLLALSVTRPLARLSRTARRIADGELNLDLPIGGSGEVRDLGEAFAKMTRTLRQRLRDTAGFAADVAHAFKSPLTSIRGAAELLDEGADGDPVARHRFLRNIELDTERLDRLVTRLLVLSRIEASEEPFGRRSLLDLLREAAERSEEPDVSIELSCAASLFVQARHVDLVTALVNLLDNALRVSPAGSVVRLEAQVTTGNQVEISVCDSGPGVPEAMRERIFERFYTTDKQNGTGLGLAIARTVAEAHGGALLLDKSYEGGARFLLRLPLASR